MDKIMAFFEGIDLTKLVPQLDTLLDKLQWVAKVAVMAGPVVMLVFGLWYLLLPPKEANYGAGFRTWFGMGSVEAWRMTQKIAGFAWTGCGLVLCIVMWLISRDFAGGDPMEMANKAMVCIAWQAGVALLSYIAISVTMLILYNSKGYRRGRME